MGANMAERHDPPVKQHEPYDELADPVLGYLEGYEGREYSPDRERPADFGDHGDWGRQGEWGTFGNRPGWYREQNLVLYGRARLLRRRAPGGKQTDENLSRTFVFLVKTCTLG